MRLETLQIKEDSTVWGASFLLPADINISGREVQGERDDSFAKARQFYEQNLESLLKEYEGRFIAIVDCQVVDCDANFSELASRVYHKFGYRDIFMPRVGRQPPSLQVPSPKLGRIR